jgi:regulator of protease activity HflC (stomatin/prohibitin superfamily)
MKIKTKEESYLDFGLVALVVTLAITAIATVVTFVDWWVFFFFGLTASVAVLQKGLKAIPVRNAGIVTFLGERKREAYKEGLIWVFPWLYDLLNVSLEPVSISVPPPGGKEFKFLAIEAVSGQTGATETAEMNAEYTLVVQPQEALLYETFNITFREAEKILVTFVNTAFRELASSRDPFGILSDPEKFKNCLVEKLEAEDFYLLANSYGLEVRKFLIRKISPSEAILADMEEIKREGLQAKSEEIETDHTMNIAENLFKKAKKAGSPISFDTAYQMALAITRKSRHQTIAGNTSGVIVNQNQ